jgi:two-component system, chemotaxis family, sensor kinase CheA
MALEKGIVDQAKLNEMPEREIIELIFKAGFSTHQKVTNISGRGVGMDAVQNEVTRLKGKFSINTEKGKGTSFHISLTDVTG